MTWRDLYQVLHDGRVVIPTRSLRTIETRDAGRILDTTLLGRSARVLLLDRPYQLGHRVDEAESDAFYLNRIRLRELPGWPHPGTPEATARELVDSKFKAARFRRSDETGPGGLELDLDQHGEPKRTLVRGCPLPLLECALATLNQPHVSGTRMIDVQELRLICTE